MSIPYWNRLTPPSRRRQSLGFADQAPVLVGGESINLVRGRRLRPSAVQTREILVTVAFFFAKPLAPVVLDRRALTFSGGITQIPLAHYPDPSQAIILGQDLD
jgi:hypothetical protein